MWVVPSYGILPERITEEDLLERRIKDIVIGHYIFGITSLL